MLGFLEREPHIVEILTGLATDGFCFSDVTPMFPELWRRSKARRKLPLNATATRGLKLREMNQTWGKVRDRGTRQNMYAGLVVPELFAKELNGGPMALDWVRQYAGHGLERAGRGR